MSLTKVTGSILPLETNIKGDTGYNFVGGFYVQEGNSSIGLLKSLSEVKGERGQFDIYPTEQDQLSGAGIIVGGEHYRAAMIVNNSGELVTQLYIDGIAATNVTHHPYIAESGRKSPDPTAYPTRLLKIPAHNRSGMNNEYDMEFSLGTDGKPIVDIHPPLLASGGADRTTYAIRIPDANKIKTQNILGRFKMPQEFTAGTLVSGKSFIINASLSASGGTMHFQMPYQLGSDICSLINGLTGLNSYISFKIRGDTVYGLYKLRNSADYFIDSNVGGRLHVVIDNFTTDPNGQPVTLSNAPGQNATDPTCNYEDIRIIITNSTLTTGTNLSDPYNSASIVLTTEPLCITKAIKNPHLSPNSTITKSVITGVNFTNSTVTQENILIPNPDYVFDFVYNRNMRYAKPSAPNPSPIENALVPNDASNYVIKIWINPNSGSFINV